MKRQSSGHTATPDYNYWARRARWGWTEFAALSLGMEPRNISAEAMQSDKFSLEEEKRYLDRRSLIENHVQAGRIGHYNNPVELLSWAKSNGISYSRKLGKAVEETGGKIADWRHENEQLRNEIAALRTQYDDPKKAVSTPTTGRPLRNDERLSLLKMVRGMAVEKYRYDPKARRNTAPSEIKSAVENQGFKITDDTVRKWLDEAFRLSLEES